LYNNFYVDFPFLKERKDKVLMAGSFLKRDMFKATMERIKQEDIKNIVIVGGSHSGFSSAWMMLHGPATFCKNNSLGPSASKFKSFPDAPLKQMKDCLECCTCDKTKKKKEIQCGCICKCFGYFTYKDWDFDYDNDLPFFAEGSIKILYRDKIRVFYGTVTQAK